MIYESAAITDGWKKSGGFARLGEPLPAEQPKAVAAIWPGEKSIQQ
jgi:hypothetical protein